MSQFWPFRRKSPQADASASDVTPRRRFFGREYTPGVPYALPSDLGEMNRLDFQHFVLRQAFKGNYAAPLRKPSRILDVGSGTGRRAKELAALFPSATVTGIDIKNPASDEQNAVSAAPGTHLASYQFIHGNILEGLPFPDASFDFVHQCLLFFAIPTDR